MKLFLSGTTEFNLDISPRVNRIREFLDKAKDGEVFTTELLVAKVKVSSNNMNKDVRGIPEYTHKIGSKRYWGKPSTIKQLIKETR